MIVSDNSSAFFSFFFAHMSVKVRNEKRKDADNNSPYCFSSDIQFQVCLYHESLVVVTEYESISLGVISKNLKKKCISFSGICLKITAVFSCLS